MIQMKVIATAGMMVAVAMATAAPPLIIDRFDTPGSPGQTISRSTVGSTTMTATTAGNDIIGSNRVVQLTYMSGTDTIDNKVNFNGNGYFSFGAGGSSRGSSLIEWDGDTTLGVNPTGLGGQDLTLGATQNMLAFRVVDLDWAGSAVFTVYSDAANFSKYTLAVPQTASPTTYYMPYADFAGVTGNANFANIGAITMEFTDGHGGTDLNFDFIETTFIPEPGAGLLLAGGLAGLSLIRRRRSSRK